jgi:hypothetical protein
MDMVYIGIGLMFFVVCTGIVKFFTTLSGGK